MREGGREGGVITKELLLVIFREITAVEYNVAPTSAQDYAMGTLCSPLQTSTAGLPLQGKPPV